MEINPVLELSYEDIKIIIITVLHMFKKQEKKMNMLSSNRKNIKI